jgi:hypothetical protein
MQFSLEGGRGCAAGKAATAIVLMSVCSLAAIIGCSDTSSAGPEATGIVTLDGVPG